MGIRRIYIKIKSNKRKNNATFKGKQRDNVNKAKPSPTFRCWCTQESQVQESHKGGVKSAGGSDCE
jgi:hypothetical protein